MGPRLIINIPVSSYAGGEISWRTPRILWTGPRLIFFFCFRSDLISVDPPQRYLSVHPLGPILVSLPIMESHETIAAAAAAAAVVLPLPFPSRLPAAVVLWTQLASSYVHCPYARAFRCLCGTTVLDKAERRMRMRCRRDANPVICTSATKRHVGSPRGVDEDCPLRGARSSEKDGKRERVSEHERPIVQKKTQKPFIVRRRKRCTTVDAMRRGFVIHNHYSGKPANSASENVVTPLFWTPG